MVVDLSCMSWLVSFVNRRGHTQLATEGSWWLVVRNWLWVKVVLDLVTLVALKMVVLIGLRIEKMV